MSEESSISSMGNEIGSHDVSTGQQDYTGEEVIAESVLYDNDIQHHNHNHHHEMNGNVKSNANSNGYNSRQSPPTKISRNNNMNNNIPNQVIAAVTPSKNKNDFVNTANGDTSTEWLTDNASSKQWIDQWTRIGLSKYVSLPMICVLGDTSSGKSSVLSSLIGLELPSASTLTTKCPVLIQLVKSSPTTTSSSPSPSSSSPKTDQVAEATVRIQWHDSNATSSRSSPRHRKRVLEKQHNHNRPTTTTTTTATISPANSSTMSSSFEDGLALPPPPPPPPPPPIWKPQTIYDISQIPKVIQKAQQIILNYRETLIAPDVICVTLKSPTCAEELTLVDLPGLVQFQHTQDISLLSQVEQVVLDYVYNPRSILLPILAAPTNIYNSKVLQWTRQVDPLTRRTIPVLTKPDLIDPGSESDVLELLQSSSSEWRHGVYMVKNRGQALLDQGASIEEGLQAEADYFATTSPWCDTGGSIVESRLGISSLRNTLAKVLWHVMEESLPDIMKEVRELYESTQSDLEAMGTIYTTRSDQRKYYHSLTQKLVGQISSSLSGKASRSSSMRARFSKPMLTAANLASAEANTMSGASQLHAACGEFFKTIQSGSLATISSLVEGANVIVSSHGSTEDVKGELVHMDPQHRFACVDYINPKDHSTEVLFDGIDYVSDQPDFEPDEVWSDGNRVFIGRMDGNFDSLRKIPLHRLRTDPSWLVEKMEHFRTDDLACFVNVNMFQQIVADFVAEDWAPPCHELIQTLEQLLTNTLDQALQEQLEGTRFPLLRNMVETACRRVAARLIETAKTQVKEHLDLEEQHPYTQDQVLLQAMNEARFSSLQHDLELQLRLDQEGVVYDTHAIQTILNRVFEKHKRQNWMAEQMELVLSCYGKVATQRVLDRTPQICWQTYRSLPNALAEELGCVTDEVLETCLWESPESRERFHSLTTKLHELQTAMEGVQTTMRTKNGISK